MDSKNFFSIAFGAAIILFDVLFWREKAGLNVFLFSGFLSGVMLILYPDKLRYLPVKITMAGSLLTAAMVVINNSALSIGVHVWSMLAFIGFLHHEQLRFIGSALLSLTFRCLEIPIFFSERFSGFISNFKGFQRFLRIMKMVVLPFFVVFLFFQIYISANSKFAELSGDFFSFLDVFSLDWLQGISPGRVLFIFLGIVITAFALIPARLNLFESWENAQSDNISRKKPGPHIWFGKTGSMMGLRNEFHSALMLIGALNVLLFIVNLVDIRFVWFGSFDVSPAILSQYVHEGTWLLIFSIVLAMGILFFVFRGNLNFLKDNIWLKRLAFIWIAQNALLAVSVAARNYHYVDHYGLAYKRIGVGIFLIITLFGLATMIIKVNERKSIFYLLRTNGWAVYAALILSCVVNWDVFITKYNLTADTKSEIDSGFLVYDVSDKNLFLLDQYHAKLVKSDPEIYDKLYFKRERFEKRLEGTTWVSWNWPDHVNKRYFR